MRTENLNSFVEQGSEVVVYIDISGSAARMDALTGKALDRLGAFLDSKECSGTVKYFDHQIRDVCHIRAGSVQRSLRSLELPSGDGILAGQMILQDFIEHRATAIVVCDRYFFEEGDPKTLGNQTMMFFYDIENPPKLPLRSRLLSTILSYFVVDKYALTGQIGMAIAALFFWFFYHDGPAAIVLGLMAVFFAVLPPLFATLLPLTGERNKKAA